jgi:hypothetical protein
VPYLLALGHEEENLIQELRGPGGAIDFFRQRDIHWWKKKETGDDLNRSGPTRNMLSSQIACVNVFMSLAADREALLLLLRSVDPEVTDIVPIASSAGTTLVEFEWCGLKSPIEGGPLRRGKYVTNADALMIGRVGQLRRAYLWEWKYIEAYQGHISLAVGQSGTKRIQTYRPLYDNSASFNSKEIPITEFFYEPFYQLMRLRLLADRMVSIPELDISSATLVLVCPEGNTAYLETITSPELLARFPKSRTVPEVFSKTMRDSSGFNWTSPQKILTFVRKYCSPLLVKRLEYLRERYGW